MAESYLTSFQVLCVKKLKMAVTAVAAILDCPTQIPWERGGLKLRCDRACGRYFSCSRDERSGTVYFLNGCHFGLEHLNLIILQESIVFGKNIFVAIKIIQNIFFTRCCDHGAPFSGKGFLIPIIINCW